MAVVNFSDSPTQTVEREEPSPGEYSMGELKVFFFTLFCELFFHVLLNIKIKCPGNVKSRGSYGHASVLAV